MKNLEAFENNSVLEQKESKTKNLQTYLDELNKITKIIATFSYLIVGASLLGLVLSFLNFYNTFWLKKSFGQESVIFDFIVLIPVCALFLLIIYEFMRKKGNTLFSEISDELEWNLKTGESRDETPSINARIILRSFVNASELPFFRGKYGAGIYLLINVVSLIFSVISLVGVASK